MDELRTLLDGEAIPHAGGFDAVTEHRAMWVPFTVTRDPAQALAICRERGLLLAKLNAMDPEAADMVYATTIATALPCA